MSDERPTVIIRVPLREYWATDEELAEMTTKEIIELCQEDPLGLLEDAEWLVSWPTPSPRPSGGQ